MIRSILKVTKNSPDYVRIQWTVSVLQKAWHGCDSRFGKSWFSGFNKEKIS